MTSHEFGKRHKEYFASANSTRSVTSFFKPDIAKNVIEAETRWTMFTAKHNFALIMPPGYLFKCFLTVK